MDEVKLTDVKKYLANITEDELRKEILELFRLFPKVKEYFAVKLNPETEKALFEKYQKIIKNEFFPDREFGKLRYAAMKKAHEDFGKIAHSGEYIADLMISHVEYGVEFTNAYGDIDEQFYDNIAGMYDKALQFVSRMGLEHIFKNRLRQIMADGDGIGWGFSDQLKDLYYDCFAE